MQVHANANGNLCSLDNIPFRFADYRKRERESITNQIQNYAKTSIPCVKAVMESSGVLRMIA
jgi:hypothetical protein